MGSWSPCSAHLHSTPAPPDLPTFWQELCFTPQHSLCEARGRLMVESTGTLLLREVETLQPGSFPSTAHAAAKQPPARSWLSEGARHHWKPGLGSSSRGKTRTRVVSAQELLRDRSLSKELQLLSPNQEREEEAEEAGGSLPSLAALVPCALWPPSYHSHHRDSTCTLDLQLLLLTPATTQDPTPCPQPNADMGRDELSPENLPSCYRPGSHSFLSAYPALTARSESCKPHRSAARLG